MAESGLNAAVTPLGKPEAEKVTLPLKLFSGLTEIVLVPWLPCIKVKLLGLAERLKFGAWVTVSCMVVVCVRLPEVPVIVTVTVPVVALELAAKLRALDEVAGLGLNAAVTPCGNPEMANVTLPENPYNGLTVTVLLPLAPPFAIASVLGEVDRVKSGGGALTVRLSVVTFFRLPEVPVICTATVPVAALALAVRVSVLLAKAGLGLKAAVTPLGSPDAEKETFPSKPPVALMVIVLVPSLPWVTVSVLALTESVKSGELVGQFTTRL